MKQEGTLTITTALKTEDARRWVTMSVIDSGPGIPGGRVAAHLETFFTTKPIGQGTGLGLGLVHEIIQKHSGTIDVNTHPGRTEFIVKFPAA